MEKTRKTADSSARSAMHPKHTAASPATQTAPGKPIARGPFCAHAPKTSAPLLVLVRGGGVVAGPVGGGAGLGLPGRRAAADGVHAGDAHVLHPAHTAARKAALVPGRGVGAAVAGSGGHRALRHLLRRA